MCAASPRPFGLLGAVASSRADHSACAPRRSDYRADSLLVPTPDAHPQAIAYVLCSVMLLSWIHSRDGRRGKRRCARRGVAQEAVSAATAHGAARDPLDPLPPAWQHDPHVGRCHRSSWQRSTCLRSRGASGPGAADARNDDANAAIRATRTTVDGQARPHRRCEWLDQVHICQ